MSTLRQFNGIAGFPKRAESPYDTFGVGHSSTSISAALGFAMANKIAGRPGKGIAVIGDGSMSAGMAYEAMNNAEAAGNRLVVILNDNDMSIAPPTGAMSAYLARLVSSHTYKSIRETAKMPGTVDRARTIWGPVRRAGVSPRMRARSAADSPGAYCALWRKRRDRRVPTVPTAGCARRRTPCASSISQPAASRGTVRRATPASQTKMAGRARVPASRNGRRAASRKSHPRKLLRFACNRGHTTEPRR